MSDPITNRVEQILTASEHLLVPVDDIYRRLLGEGWMAGTSFELFEELLSTDERFELYEGLGDSELIHPELHGDLEAHGLLGGPLIMLKMHESTPEKVMLDVLSHLQEMNKTLETAWHARPAGNPQAETELLNLLMVGDMLEREIKRALDNGLLLINLEPLQSKPGTDKS